MSYEFLENERDELIELGESMDEASDKITSISEIPRDCINGDLDLSSFDPRTKDPLAYIQGLINQIHSLTEELLG